ncbi:MAG: hypothetical protein COB85_07755, partial [Bacteroidetes bacterium]
MKENITRSGLEIAVIGIACRFPGARNKDEFWHNLKNGVESVSFFSDEELLDHGISDELFKKRNYVKAKSVLEDIEYFDPSFFGYSPREAQNMDPQLRILLETSWHALEDAGYNADNGSSLIGLYMGASPNLAWISQFFSKMDNPAELHGLSILNDTSSFATSIAYNLNLQGPAVSVNTACSTSLVAIHMACKGLLNGECDLAMAGGVSVTLPNKSGYLYQDGMIFSPDGHCRAFDAKAKGTINGDGAGIVVLKPLEEAIADRDNIYAVVKESTINNDGKRKVGYSAPSVKGQAELIKTNLYAADIDPESISYVEAHGTGTALGDPVEIEALKQAFDTKKKQYCAIGSVKTNIGHLDVAAGVAGFIKTVLAVQHKSIPPSLHFNTPNPRIDFENSPFYVNTALQDWKNDQYPLRAGVSSFGIGGTNAHITLEEAPNEQTHPIGRKWNLLLLSAKTKYSLDEMTDGLLTYFKLNPKANITGAAYTLQTGRKAFDYRKMLLCSNVGEAVEILTSRDTEYLKTNHLTAEDRSIVFMFPGQGAQYINMGLELYKSEPVFREEVERCCDQLDSLLEYDVKKILYPTKNTKQFIEKIKQTEIAQPLLFVIEYALAKLLMHWGVKPDKMIGHSIGEYVAGCLAGVFSLEDALRLVAHRGQLMQRMPPGAMISVNLTEKELKPLLYNGLSLAAVNSSSFCVLSGTHKSIAEFEKLLKEKGHNYSYLHTSHAFHSEMMEPILKDFEDLMKKITLNKPEIPYLSNTSGTWITDREAQDPTYWVNHLRRTILYSQGAEELLKDEHAIFIEVGPGTALSSFIRKHESFKPNQKVLNIIRHPLEEIPDDYYLLKRIGELWLNGLNIDWSTFHSEYENGRVSLPPYPFDRQRYWTLPHPSKKEDSGEARTNGIGLNKKSEISEWFYIPFWEKVNRINASRSEITDKMTWLVFSNGSPWERKILAQLKRDGQDIINVKVGSAFTKQDDGAYLINPQNQADYLALFNELVKSDNIPNKIIHCWSLSQPDNQELIVDEVNDTLNLGYHCLLHIAQAIGEEMITNPVEIAVITNNVHSVIGNEQLRPDKATVMGPVKVIPHEYNNVKCCNIDIDWGDSDTEDKRDLFKAVYSELWAPQSKSLIAFRNNQRYTLSYKKTRLKKASKAVSRLKTNGVYLIAGGFGGIGFSMAKYLASNFKARLVLMIRSKFPAKKEWQKWLKKYGPSDRISKKILDIQTMESEGAKVMIVRADICDHEQVQRGIGKVKTRFGQINGVLHCAGLAEGALIQRRTRMMSQKTLLPKVIGTLTLDAALSGMKLDYFALFSSLGNILDSEKIGQVGYNAGNEFFDAYADYKSSTTDTLTVSINWEDWQTVGMSVRSAKQLDKVLNYSADSIDNVNNFNLNIGEPGNLETLNCEYVQRRAPDADEVEIEVWAAGLNFKDVLYATGLLPAPEDSIIRFGQECSGKIAAVGKNVKNFKYPNQILNKKLDCSTSLSSYVICTMVMESRHFTCNQYPGFFW